MSSIPVYFGGKLLVFHIEGCNSIVGFEVNLGQFPIIVKIRKSKGDD